MAVVSGPITLTGGVGVKPMIKYLLSTDSLSTVTTAGYLNEELLQYGDISKTDLLLIRYDYVVETGAGTNAFFNVAISNGVITLSEDTTTNSVTYTSPSIANRIAVFTNTTGNIGDDAATAINAGNIQAGLSGTAGTLASFPSTASKGSLKVVAVANTGDTVTTLSNMEMGQTTTINIIDPNTSTGYVQVSTVNSDPCSNLIWKEVDFNSLQLASGGTVTAYLATTGARYRIREMFFVDPAGGTAFSGGGGDRNLSLSDGTTVYTVIPAADLQAPANTRWGSTALPFPAAASIDAPTVASANLTLQYSGGTADYAAGNLNICICLERFV